MKNIKRNCLLILGVVVSGTVFLGVMVSALAQTVPQPVLKIAPSGTNLVVTITNGVSFANYELYRAPILNDTNFPFTLYAIGTLGQTNFTVVMGLDPSGYLKIGVGTDWDGDGIPNYMDGNPSDPLVGALSITIDSPANGTVFN